MAAIIPVALQLLPMIPSLIDNALKIVEVLRGDPATPEEARATLDELSVKLAGIVERVRQVPLVPVRHE